MCQLLPGHKPLLNRDIVCSSVIVRAISLKFKSECARRIPLPRTTSPEIRIRWISFASDRTRNIYSVTWVICSFNENALVECSRNTPMQKNTRNGSFLLLLLFSLLKYSRVDFVLGRKCFKYFWHIAKTIQDWFLQGSLYRGSNQPGNKAASYVKGFVQPCLVLIFAVKFFYMVTIMPCSILKEK